MDTNARPLFPLRGIVLILLAIILFEAFQQDYYIRTFDLLSQSKYSIWGLFENHLWRWLVWCVTALLFFKILLRLAKHDMNNRVIFITALSLIFFVALDVLLISVLAISRNDLDLTGERLMEYFEFYTYQKGPLYTIAYISVGIYTFLSYKNRELSISLESLHSAKDSSYQSYKELQEKNWNDQTEVLNVRIGRKVKLIPVDDIDWIESDNYCVKIHTSDSNNYTLRSTMKKLEEILPNPHFIRIHRTAIVNTERISEVVTGKNPLVILNDKIKIDVASSRLPLIKNFLHSNSPVSDLL